MEFFIWFVIVSFIICGLVFLSSGGLMLIAYNKESYRHDEREKENYRKTIRHSLTYGGASIVGAAIAGLLLFI